MGKSTYPLWLIFILSLCCISIAQNSSTPVVQNAGPRLAFEEESFDFGTIDPGAVVEHVFQFENVSKDTVYIKNVSSG